MRSVRDEHACEPLSDLGGDLEKDDVGLSLTVGRISGTVGG